MERSTITMERSTICDGKTNITMERSTFENGKSTISTGPCSIAMLNYQRVSFNNWENSDDLSD